RRLVHQYEAIEVVQLVGDAGGLFAEFGGQVTVVVLRHQRARCVGGADQADRRARAAEADGRLRAYRDQLEVLGEHLAAQRRTLVSAVVAHSLAEQAGADAEPETVAHDASAFLYKSELLYKKACRRKVVQTCRLVQLFRRRRESTRAPAVR